jgi:hypothetical protein
MPVYNGYTGTCPAVAVQIGFSCHCNRQFSLPKQTSKACPCLFENADADPPESALSEESRVHLCSADNVSMDAVVSLVKHAIVGDVTVLRAFRDTFAIPRLLMTVTMADSRVSFVPVRRYSPRGVAAVSGWSVGRFDT